MKESNKILELLPHRKPFLFVDGITEIRVPKDRDDGCGSFIRGFKRVSPDEFYLKGHFPGLPIMPGVLIIEAIAQLALCIISDPANKIINPKEDLLVLTKVDGFKFRRMVVPNETIELEATITKQKMKRFLEAHGKATVQNELVAEGFISCMVQKKGRMQS